MSECSAGSSEGVATTSYPQIVKVPRVQDTSSSLQHGYVPKVALPDRGAASVVHSTSHSFRRPSIQLAPPVYSAETGPEWLASVHRELHDLTKIPRDWDTYDGVAVTDSAFEGAASFIATVSNPTTHQPSVVPTSEGGVQVEWHTGGYDVEAYFPPFGPATFFARNELTGWEFEGAIDSARKATIAAIVTAMSRLGHRLKVWP